MKKTLLLMGCVLALPAFAATDLFAKMDVDRDGRISAQEHAMGSRGMFVAMDADKDERVTAAEMTAAQARITGEAASGGMTSAEKIKVVDGDRDGVLTAAEHAAGSRAMFAKMDRNNDGRLSRREFNAEHEKLTAARR